MRKIVKMITVLMVFEVLVLKQISYAGIFPDIFEFFKSSVNQEVETETAKSVDEANDFFGALDEIIKESSLSKDEKDVKKVIEEIYDALINADTKKALENIEFNLSTKYIINLDNFFTDYEESRNSVKKILSTIKYKITSYEKVDDEIMNVKIFYTFPSIKNLIEKTFSTILAKNAGDLILGKFGNKNIASILEILSNEIEKNDYKIETNEYTFNFKNIFGKWKLSGINEIAEQIQKYSNEVTGNLLK